MMRTAGTRGRRSIGATDENIFARVVSAFARVLFVFTVPLITFKICVQDGRALPTSVGGWYRGVFANAASLAPITAAQVGINGAIERAITGGTRGMSDAEQIGCAMAAGALSSALYSPVDLTVIQQQKMGLGPGGTVSAVIKQGGLGKMWRGTVSCAARESIYTAGYLGLGPVLTNKIKASQPELGDLTASIIGSSLAGTLAAGATHPIDTAKTMMQSDLAGARYSSASAALSEAYKSGGIGALYKGGLARTVRICGAFFIVGNIREFAVAGKNGEGGPFASFF
jgi:hypothetical protein